MNIFKEMILSIYSYKSYQQFLKNKKSKVFAFGVMLMLAYFTITTVAPFMKFVIVDGGMTAFLEENIPEFELKNGYLWAEESIEYSDYNSYVYINTDPEYFLYSAEEMTEYLRNYSQVILMDSEKVIVKDDGMVNELYFADLEMDISKENVMEIVPYLYMILIAAMILMYLFGTAAFFFGVLFVALMGMIAASCMKYNLTFGQLYLLGIYSRTLPLLIKAVLSLLSINFFAFVFINFGISVAIIVCVIRKMKEAQLQLPLEFN